MPQVLIQVNFRKSGTSDHLLLIYTQATVPSGADKADRLLLSSAGCWLLSYLALKKSLHCQIQNRTPSVNLFATTGTGCAAPPWSTGPHHRAQAGRPRGVTFINMLRVGWGGRRSRMETEVPEAGTAASRDSQVHFAFACSSYYQTSTPT